MWHTIYLYLDASLIFFFRLADNPVLGYFSGIAVLSLACVIAGEWTISLAYRFNRNYIAHDNSELVRLQNLSVDAIQAGDGDSYKACNREANEAFGKVFFYQVALGSASLWPVPFAMAWLETRFGEVLFDLPFGFSALGDQVGFGFTFLPMYVLVRIVFGKVQHHIPYFRRTKALVGSTTSSGERMKSFSEIASVDQR
ncbi:MAG: hypothetical protein PVH30_01915 [Desulfobacterales bacterium]|jgi:hypothetical protein